MPEHGLDTLITAPIIVSQLQMPLSTDSLIPILFALLGALIATTVVGVFAYLRLRQAHAALRQRYARYEEIVENANDGIWMIDPDGKTLYANESLAKILGWSVEELLGMNLLDIVPPEIREATRQAMLSRVQGEHMLASETPMRRKDGTLIEIFASDFPLFKGKQYQGAVAFISDISERKQAQREATDYLRQFEALAESLPDSVVRLDRELRHVYVNQATERVLGVGVAQAQNKRVGDLDFPLDVRQQLESNINQVFDTSSETQLEFSISTDNGNARYFETRLIPERNADGVALTVLGITRDITERKQMERDLRQRDRRLRLMLDNTPITLFEIDPDGIFTYSAGAGLNAFNLKPSDQIGQSVFTYYADAPEALSDTHRALNGEKIVTFHEYHGIGVMIMMTPIVDDGDKQSGVVGMSLDITNQRAIANALQTVELRYQTIFNSINDIAFVLDHEGRAMLLNPALERVLGYPVERWYGRDISDLTHPEDRAIATANFAQTMQNQPPEPFVIRLLDRDGVAIPFEFDTQPQVEDDIVVSISGIARDITERQLAETRNLALSLERERLNLLNRFLRGVAHDLRTPLAVIQSSSELIARKLDAAQLEIVQRHLDVISAQIRHLSQQIDNLRTASHLNRDPAEYNFAVMELNDCVEMAIDEMRPHATDHDLTLTFAPMPDLPSINGDFDELSRALRHMLHNAIAYNEAGGHVTVRTFVDDGFAGVAIRDTGIGIPVEALPLVVQPFYRVDIARQIDTGGTGLGLAITDAIARAHKGMLEIESEFGVGTTATLLLPLAER